MKQLRKKVEPCSPEKYPALNNPTIKATANRIAVSGLAMTSNVVAEGNY